MPSGAPICHKGAVISDGDAPDVFRELQFQLAFPAVQMFLNRLSWLFRWASERWGKPSEWKFPLDGLAPIPSITIYPPVVVTNAPIFTLNDGISLQEIESSKRVEDIATSRDFVTMVMAAPGELSKFLEERAGDLLRSIAAWSEGNPTSFSMCAAELQNLASSGMRVSFVRLPAVEDFFRAYEASARLAVARIRRDFVPNRGPTRFSTIGPVKPIPKAPP